MWAERSDLNPESRTKNLIKGGYWVFQELPPNPVELRKELRKR